MSSSSLANWDGSQSTRNPKQSFKDGVRSGFTGIDNDRADAALDASLAKWEDHRAVSRPGEGYNQGISSIARVHTQTKTPTISHLSSNVNTTLSITQVSEEENVVTREDQPGSTYSTDAEGEPDDEHAQTSSEIIELSSSLPMHKPQGRRQVDANVILATTVSETTKAQHQQNSMPYTPASLELPHSPLHIHDSSSLFTPPPSDQSASPSLAPRLQERVYLSHVAVPPFPTGRTHSDYVRISLKTRPRPVDVHQSLGEALQASLDHNAQVGALHTTSALHTKKREGWESYQFEKKMREPTRQNAIAGPSTVSIVRYPREEAGRMSSKRDREESCDDDPRRKRMRTYQDAERRSCITHEELPSKRSTRTCSYPHTEYNEEEDSLELFIGTIPPVPAAVLSLNTRFARAATHAKEIDKEKENRSKSHKKVIYSSHGWKKSWFTWPPGRPSFLDTVEGEYLAGGLVKQEANSGDDRKEGEVILSQSRTKSRRDLSPSECMLGARSKENKKEKEVVKRSIRAVNPLPKYGPPSRPKPRFREASPKTVCKTESEHHDVHQERSISPLALARPSSMKVNRELPSERHEDGREGTVSREFDANVIQETSLEWRDGSPEQLVSPSDRHRPRKPISVAMQGVFRKRDTSQEGMISPPGHHQSRKPSTRVTEESPLESHGFREEGTIVPPGRHRTRKSSSTTVQELSLEQEKFSPSGRPQAPSTIAQELSEQYGITQESLFSPPRRPGPSAKALGKQRAVTPLDTRVGSDSPSPVPQFTVNHDIPPCQPQSYSPAVSNELTLRTDFFASSTRLGVAPFMPQVPLNDLDNFLGVLPQSPSGTYDLDPRQILADIPFLPPSITTHFGDFSTSPEFEEATINPWQVNSNVSSSLSGPPPSTIYGHGSDGTINPCLLGGVQDMDLIHYTPPASPALPSPSHPVEHLPSWDIVSRSRSRSARSVSPSRSPIPSSSSSSSSFPSKSPTSPPPPLASQSSPSRSVRRKPSIPVSEYAESETATSIPLRAARPSRHAFRQMPDGMIPTSELQLYVSSDDESEPIADRIRRAKTSSVVMKVEQPQKQKRAVEASNGSRSEPRKGKRAGRTKWPVCDSQAFCHQCRCSSNIAKLRCPCGKKYCVRCLSTRYEGEFIYDPSRTTFTCPCCQKTCTCDVCTRKRGGVYVSLRPRHGGSPQPLRSRSPAILSRSERVKSKPKKVPELLASMPPPARPRSSLGGKTNLPPLLGAPMAGSETYWATMYAVTGERIGRAFVGEEGKHDVVRVRALQGGKRVFVGAVQPSWGLGPNAVLKDVDPPKKKITSDSHPRYYIGSKTVLYHPIAEPGKVEDSWELYDGFSSPLSFLDDDPLSGGEGGD